MYVLYTHTKNVLSRKPQKSFLLRWSKLPAAFHMSISYTFQMNLHRSAESQNHINTFWFCA